jgi:hypothetical protein
MPISVSKASTANASNITGWKAASRVTALSNGTYVVAWEQISAGPDEFNSDYTIHARLYNADGTAA